MNFLLDHDVPVESARLLRREGHGVSRLIEVLPVTTLDPEVFAHAKAHGLVTVTCNRKDFLAARANRASSGPDYSHPPQDAPSRVCAPAATPAQCQRLRPHGQHQLCLILPEDRREQQAAKLNFDLKAILADTRQRQKDSGHRVVSFVAKPKGQGENNQARMRPGLRERQGSPCDCK